MKNAVYAGSFDPITNGHLWMINHAATMFDELVVAIGDNPDKRCTFTLKERLEMLKESVKDFKNVKVATFENQFLVNYARSIGVNYMIRGIRTDGDYEYERVMRNINSDMNPDVVTVFLMPPREIADLSSSMVKGLVGPNGWEKVVKIYVPDPVYEKFLEKFGKQPAKR